MNSIEWYSFWIGFICAILSAVGWVLACAIVAIWTNAFWQR